MPSIYLMVFLSSLVATQIDDIAFSLAKMDVLGKEMQRACTAKCFRYEFRKEKKRNKQMSILLKSIYFVNLLAMIGGMAAVSMKQIRYLPDATNL